MTDALLALVLLWFIHSTAVEGAGASEIIDHLSYTTAGVCSLADSVIQASTETTTRRSLVDCAVVCSNKAEGCIAYTYTESETVFRFI